MTRLPDWDIRLRALIDVARSTAFEWGAHDCCTFACRDVEAITGALPAIPPEWADEETAAALLAARSIEDRFSDVFGLPLDGWRRGRRGDLALIDTTGGRLGAPAISAFAVGVVVGESIACPGPARLGFVQLRKGLKVWPIG